MWHDLGDVSLWNLEGNKRPCHSNSMLENMDKGSYLIYSLVTVSTQCFYPDSPDSFSRKR